MATIVTNKLKYTVREDDIGLVIYNSPHWDDIQMVDPEQWTDEHEAKLKGFNLKYCKNQTHNGYYHFRKTTHQGIKKRTWGKAFEDPSGPVLRYPALASVFAENYNSNEPIAKCRMLYTYELKERFELVCINGKVREPWFLTYQSFDNQLRKKARKMAVDLTVDQDAANTEDDQVVPGKLSSGHTISDLEIMIRSLQQNVDTEEKLDQNGVINTVFGAVSSPDTSFHNREPFSFSFFNDDKGGNQSKQQQAREQRTNGTNKVGRSSNDKMAQGSSVEELVSGQANPEPFSFVNDKGGNQSTNKVRGLGVGLSSQPSKFNGLAFSIQQAPPPLPPSLQYNKKKNDSYVVSHDINDGERLLTKPQGPQPPTLAIDNNYQHRGWPKGSLNYQKIVFKKFYHDCAQDMATKIEFLHDINKLRSILTSLYAFGNIGSLPQSIDDHQVKPLCLTAVHKIESKFNFSVLFHLHGLIDDFS